MPSMDKRVRLGTNVQSVGIVTGSFWEWEAFEVQALFIGSCEPDLFVLTGMLNFKKDLCFRSGNVSPSQRKQGPAVTPSESRADDDIFQIP